MIYDFFRLGRFSISCKHPAHKNKIRGNIEVEACILPKSEADVDPVGNGRDEPNKDPFLPPITENRTYVDWVTINEKLGDATASIMQGLKWTGIFIMFVCIYIAFKLVDPNVVVISSKVLYNKLIIFFFSFQEYGLWLHLLLLEFYL